MICCGTGLSFSFVLGMREPHSIWVTIQKWSVAGQVSMLPFMYQVKQECEDQEGTKKQGEPLSQIRAKGGDRQGTVQPPGTSSLEQEPLPHAPLSLFSVTRLEVVLLPPPMLQDLFCQEISVQAGLRALQRRILQLN